MVAAPSSVDHGYSIRLPCVVEVYPEISVENHMLWKLFAVRMAHFVSALCSIFDQPAHRNPKTSLPPITFSHRKLCINILVVQIIYTLCDPNIQAAPQSHGNHWKWILEYLTKSSLLKNLLITIFRVFSFIKRMTF